MQLRDTKGEVNLTFLVGKADLDDKNPQNQVELNRLNQELRAIETNPDASLKSFHITGGGFAGRFLRDESSSGKIAYG